MGNHTLDERKSQGERKPYTKPVVKKDDEVKVNLLGGSGCTAPDIEGCGDTGGALEYNS